MDGLEPSGSSAKILQSKIVASYQKQLIAEHIARNLSLFSRSARVDPKDTGKSARQNGTIFGRQPLAWTLG